MSSTIGSTCKHLHLRRFDIPIPVFFDLILATNGASITDVLLAQHYIGSSKVNVEDA